MQVDAVLVPNGGGSDPAPARLAHTASLSAGEAMPAGHRGAPLAPLRVGLLTDAAPAHDRQVAYGAQAAARGFMRAALAHSTSASYDLFCPLHLLEGVRSGLDVATGEADGTDVQVWPLHLISARSRCSKGFVMHDPTAHPWRLYYLRSNVARHPFPVTLTHYTVSYPFLRDEFYLPLLLAGTQPYDAYVCLGRAARHAVAALLDQVKEAFQSEYGVRLDFNGQLEVIPVGVDTDVLRPRERGAARIQLGLPRDKLIILSFGRFSIRDKMDLLPLLQAFRQLERSSRAELLLVLAGSDPDGHAKEVDAAVRELQLQGKVEILTNPDQSFVPLLYSAADLFVSVSDNVQEMFGQTPVEAMATGIPVVVSDWDGYRETVVHGEVGFRVPTTWGPCDNDLCSLAPVMPGLQDHTILAQSVAVDCRKLYECLKALTENEELRRRFGEAGRRRAVAEYSWRTVLSMYESLWAELARIAATHPQSVKPGLRYLMPDYARTFGHFSTHTLEPTTRLVLTELGRRTLAGREPLRISASVAAYLGPGALHRALLRMRTRGRRRTEICVETLLALLTADGSMAPAAAYRHVLWLLKQGLAVTTEHPLPCPSEGGRRPRRSSQPEPPRPTQFAGGQAAGQEFLSTVGAHK